MTRRECTCAGTAPGYPQHESFCGQDERDAEQADLDARTADPEDTTNDR